MTDKELLKQELEEKKAELESKGFYLGEEGEIMDLFPSMKQYEYAFQAAIEDVYPDKVWWQVTNYWDIFQDSIMSGKSADEVIQDILDHVVVEETESKEVENDDYDFEDIDDDIEFDSDFENDDEDEIITDREEVLTDKEKPNYIKDESLDEECEECKVSNSVFELVKDLDEGE